MATESPPRRYLAISALLVPVLLHPLSSVGQRLEQASSPPASLPPLILECETAPNYSACSVWVWHGTSYSASWPNGAVGQITVSNTSLQHMQFERRDSAGPVAGLTATYTAKWDGKSFTDGKITANLKGTTSELTWAGSPTATPVLAQRDKNFLNWYPAPLTAYAIFTNKGSFNQSVGTEINDYRFRDEPPMNAGEARAFTTRYLHMAADYGNGITYPQASVIAAIYADGTTFGNRKVLDAMLEKRKLMIAALTDIGTRLCSMRKEGAPIADIERALDRQQAAQNERPPDAKGIHDHAYSYVQKSLGSRESSRLAPDQAIRRTFDKLNKLRLGLAADPVRDASGHPAISPLQPLTCE